MAACGGGSFHGAPDSGMTDAGGLLEAAVRDVSVQGEAEASAPVRVDVPGIDVTQWNPVSNYGAVQMATPQPGISQD